MSTFDDDRRLLKEEDVESAAMGGMQRGMGVYTKV
jgi:hypothetical protein